MYTNVEELELISIASLTTLKKLGMVGGVLFVFKVLAL